MLRYVLAGLAFKAFSLNPATKSLYRKLGNRFGARSDMHQYLERGNAFLRLIEKHDLIQPGDELLELGTGWMHWHSIFIRLHYDAQISMFDVWDNRQFDNLLENFSQLKGHFEKNEASPLLKRDLLDVVSKQPDFDALYRSLDLKYFINSTGSLDDFADDSFDCVFSSDVLEHIDEASAAQYVKDIHRVLRPGGYSMHYIACDDHLSHYDAKENPKTYLRYSQKTWHRCFENSVQYFNRLQKPDWLKNFQEAGFTMIDQEQRTIELNGAKISDRFKDYSRDDLSCCALTTVHRKP